MKVVILFLSLITPSELYLLKKIVHYYLSSSLMSCFRVTANQGARECIQIVDRCPIALITCNLTYDETYFYEVF